MNLYDDISRCLGDNTEYKITITGHEMTPGRICNYRSDCERYRQRFKGGINTPVTMMMCETDEHIIEVKK